MICQQQTVAEDAPATRTILPAAGLLSFYFFAAAAVVTALAAAWAVDALAAALAGAAASTQAAAPSMAAAVAAAVKNTKTRRTAVGGMPAAVLFLGFRREGNSFDKSTLLTYTEKHA